MIYESSNYFASYSDGTDIYKRKQKKYPKLPPEEIVKFFFQDDFTVCHLWLKGNINPFVGVSKRNIGDRHLMAFAERYGLDSKTTIGRLVKYIERKYAGDTYSREAGMRLAYSRALSNFISNEKEKK